MRKMKAFLVSGLCALLAAVSVGTCDVQADHFKGADNWNVTFTPQAQMVSNFRTADDLQVFQFRFQLVFAGRS